MSKRAKRFVVIAAVLTAALVVAIAYHHHTVTIEKSRHQQKPLTNDASSALDKQLLRGNFGDAVSVQQRQAVEAALQDSSESGNPEPQAPDAVGRAGKEKIVLTQPVQTTVEDIQPTFTWDTPFDGWTYRVRIEDGDSHQIVASSGPLDEAIWRAAVPLVRGHIYFWQVDANDPQSHSAQPTYQSPKGQFLILSEEGEQEVQRARSGNPSHLVLGSLYTRYKMWPEAVLEYRKLVSEMPDSPDAIKLLRNAELHSRAQAAAAASQ